MDGIQILAKIMQESDDHLECHVTAQGINNPDDNLVSAASMLATFLNAAANARLSCVASEVSESLEVLRNMMAIFEGYLVYLQSSDDQDTQETDQDTLEGLNIDDLLSDLMNYLNSDNQE